MGGPECTRGLFLGRGAQEWCESFDSACGALSPRGNDPVVATVIRLWPRVINISTQVGVTSGGRGVGGRSCEES